MHRKLDKFESKENRLSRQINSMSTVINDVKQIEDDLVSKEKQLEKKIDQTKENNGGWGADHIEMHPLMPHFSPPKNMHDTLKEIGERIHEKVMNLRKEVFGDKDGQATDEFPHVRIFKFDKPPPFFPHFLHFADEK